MSETLRNLEVGARAKVAGYAGSGANYRKKLLSMGLTPGTELAVVRVAPLGDPVEIKVRGFSLSLRKGEAEALQVERIPA